MILSWASSFACLSLFTCGLGKYRWHHLFLNQVKSSLELHGLKKVLFAKIYNPPRWMARIHQVFTGQIREYNFFVIRMLF